MQKDVANSVMKELAHVMADFEVRQKTAFVGIEKEMIKNIKGQQDVMSKQVKDLEKYTEEVHNHQINDYEKLKKIATDSALGIYG